MKGWRLFLIVATIVTVAFVYVNLPRVTFVQFDGSSTEYSAGRPMNFARYSVWADNGKTFNSYFTPGNVLINVVAWLLVIAVVWYFTKPRRSTPG